MKKNGFVLCLVLLAALTLGDAAFAKRNSSRGIGSVRVKGHGTKSGKYTSTHRRTRPDGRKSNNWSAKGNVNPYTGKTGTVNP